ncbi:ribonuclease H-like domain-containing protein [Hypoxylon crocopeplum]|nr:ribonuclease H-like domain-containing protein [Hypoxylon crocopeplum]
MGYVMEFYVDGGCRNNGRPYATGAAAACLMSRGHQRFWTQTRRLPTGDYFATSQRAELLAIVIALEWALEKYEDLDSYPHLSVDIYSDSRYAVGCITDWIYKWLDNGWTNTKGGDVANRDLIQELSDLDDRVKELGVVNYHYTPREQNENADKACNDALDEIEELEDESESDDDW